MIPLTILRLLDLPLRIHLLPTSLFLMSRPLTPSTPRLLWRPILVFQDTLETTTSQSSCTEHGCPPREPPTSRRSSPILRANFWLTPFSDSLNTVPRRQWSRLSTTKVRNLWFRLSALLIACHPKRPFRLVRDSWLSPSRTTLMVSISTIRMISPSSQGPEKAGLFSVSRPSGTNSPAANSLWVPPWRLNTSRTTTSTPTAPSPTSIRRLARWSTGTMFCTTVKTWTDMILIRIFSRSLPRSIPVLRSRNWWVLFPNRRSSLPRPFPAQPSVM